LAALLSQHDGYWYKPSHERDIIAALQEGQILRRLPFLFLLVLAGAIKTTGAQDAQNRARPADGGTREVLISILIPSLANGPFTAIVNTEWIRLLADGSSITLKNHRAIARDKDGRIFQERRVLVPEENREGSPVSQIEISDPVSHELIICVPQEMVCQVEDFFAPLEPPSPLAQPAQGPNSTGIVDLGKRFIERLETIGRQETVTISKGQIGNNSPLLVKREYWYSPLLGINLSSSRSDPRFGTQNFEVTDVVIGEPDAKLFAVPSGSKMINLKSPAGTGEPLQAPQSN
jgi:hypothetical protein